MTHFGFFITEKLREIIHLEPLWEKKRVIKPQTSTLPRVFQTFSPVLFFYCSFKGRSHNLIFYHLTRLKINRYDTMSLFQCFAHTCTLTVWLCVQIPSSSSSSSSVFEPSLLHSMASGIQIAIKGLSVSSWCSIDLQQESNPDYEVQ